MVLSSRLIWSKNLNMLHARCEEKFVHAILKYIPTWMTSEVAVQQKKDNIINLTIGGQSSIKGSSAAEAKCCEKGSLTLVSD